MFLKAAEAARNKSEPTKVKHNQSGLAEKENQNFQNISNVINNRTQSNEHSDVAAQRTNLLVQDILDSPIEV